MRRQHRILGVIALVVLGTAVLPGVTAAQSTPTPTEPALVVDLEESGNATVTLVLTYDLANDDEAAAFEQLRNETGVIAANYEERLSSVATQTAAETERSMTVTDGTAELTTTETTGIVRLSVTWANLAASDGTQLTIAEPFASGFETDRRVIVRPPADYTVTNSAVPADQTTDQTVEWAANTDLSGFAVTMEPTTADDGETNTPSADGQGMVDEILPVVLAIALLGAGLTRLRRQ